MANYYCAGAATSPNYGVVVKVIEWMVPVGVGLILVVGSLLQRVTGMGLALVASPFLTLVLGPETGVQLLQLVGLGVCLVSAIILRADINYRRAAVLFIAALVGLLPGVWVARVLPDSWLSIGVGGITLLALTSILLLKKTNLFAGTKGTIIAGAASGFMNVTAGIGGPPLVVYATSTKWKYVEYVATVQVFFAGLNVASLAGRGIPTMSLTVWIIALASSVIGLILGNWVGKTLNEKVARVSILVIAFFGAIGAVIRGITLL